MVTNEYKTHGQIAKTAGEFQSAQKVREMTQRCPKIIPWSNGTINESLMMISPNVP